MRVRATLTYCALLWLGACVRSSPAPSEQRAESAPTLDAAPPTPPPPVAADASTECPGTTAELTAGTCQPQYFYRRCTTPDAVCFCAPRAFCGGALAPPQDSGTWACKANDPDTGKPDPCFGALPKHGQACEDEGRVCTGGAPCVEVQSKATCRDGKWFVVRGRVGPPPE